MDLLNGMGGVFSGDGEEGGQRLGNGRVLVLSICSSVEEECFGAGSKGYVMEK